MLKIWREFRWWAGAMLICAIGVFFMAHQEQTAADKYRADHARYCAAFMTTKEQKITCEEEKKSADDYLGWGYKLFEWPNGITAWAIIATGFVIGWQSWETRKSADAALLGAKASIAQIEHSKNVQRAQIRIDFAIPTFSYDAEVKGYAVDFLVTLDGTTRAFVLDDSIFAYVSNKSKRKEWVWKGLGLPRHMTPETGTYEGKTVIHSPDGFPAEVERDMNTLWKAQRGMEGWSLYIDGQILYRDIFGDEWILKIDRYWDTQVGIWAPFGSGRGDTHNEVKRKSG